MGLYNSKYVSLKNDFLDFKVNYSETIYVNF